jgi:hypothetical protein
VIGSLDDETVMEKALKGANLHNDALLDLLVKQVTEGLTPEEQRALDHVNNVEARAYAQGFEHAAAAVILAAAVSETQTPSSALRARIVLQAQACFAPAVTESKVVLTGTPATLRSSSRLNVQGWYAAATCLILAAPANAATGICRAVGNARIGQSGFEPDQGSGRCGRHCRCRVGPVHTTRIFAHLGIEGE